MVAWELISLFLLKRILDELHYQEVKLGGTIILMLKLMPCIYFLCVATALADEKDYFGLPSAFSFASGQSISCYNISILDDNEYESKEIIALTLSSPDFTGVIVSRPQSVVEIVDNDEGNKGVSCTCNVPLIITLFNF